jgi:UPF0755 protein
MADIENKIEQPSRNRFALKTPNEALQPIAAPEPPPKRRRKGGFLAKISGFFTLAVVLGCAGGGVVYYVTSQLNIQGPLPADKIVMIPRNSSGDDIIDQLARENIIAHPGVMSAYIMAKRPKFRAGEYVFKKQSSMAEVLDTLVNGKPITHKVNIPEGLTSEQIVERLIENEVLTGEIAETPREGTLLPDTYTFERGYTREQMLKSMRLTQEKLVKDVWARRSPDVPIRSTLELVTLASIVEKETGKADERPRVAGVFVNRLNRDMRLQTDPTVIYGIVGGKGSLGRGLTRTELDTPTPFNTYLIKGLPPGPIANPGKAALEAAANPMKTRDIFFVADGKGGHSFAETNEQHNKNVARWRQIEQSQKEAAPAQAPSIPSLAPAPELSPNNLRLPMPQLAPRSSITVPTKPVQQAQNRSIIRVTAFDNMPMPKAEKPQSISALSIDTSALDAVAIREQANTNSLGFIDSDPAITQSRSGQAVTRQVESFPVPSYRRTGNSTASTPVDIASAYSPEPQEGLYPNQASSTQALSYQQEPNQPPMRSRAFDAVAGTSKDPLLNKTYDLNSPKTIPNLR